MENMAAQTEDKREALQQQLKQQLAAYPIALDPKQVADILGVTRRYVDQLIDDKKIESFVLDKTMKYKQKRVLKATLIAFMIDNNQSK